MIMVAAVLGRLAAGGPPATEELFVALVGTTLALSSPYVAV